MLQDTAFGNFQSAINLCNILNEINNPRLTKWISRHIDKFYKRMHVFHKCCRSNKMYPETRDMKEEFAEYLLLQSVNKLTEKVKNSSSFPYVVYTHTITTLTSIKNGYISTRMR